MDENYFQKKKCKKKIKIIIQQLTKHTFLEILGVINDFHKAHGGPGKFWLGHRLFVYIDDPKHFEIILNAPNSLNKGASYDFIVESIGYGLITLKCNLKDFLIEFMLSNFGQFDLVAM